MSIEEFTYLRLIDVIYNTSHRTLKQMYKMLLNSFVDFIQKQELII